MTGRTAPPYSPQTRRQKKPGAGAGLARAAMLVLAPALIIAFGFAAVWDTGTATSSPAAAVVLDQEEQQFLDLLNAYRAELGLPALVIDSRLQAAARWMSEDMAAKDYFSHYDSLGRDPFQRMDAFGYNYNVWKGENLAAGTADAEVAFQLWKDSPGHNANMTSDQFRGIGIARAYGPTAGLRWFWATDFGGIANADPPAEPTPSPNPTPTASPSPSPSPTPAPTPSATPAASPTSTPTPAPGATLQGDLDCDAEIDARDALMALRIVAGLPPADCGLAGPDVDCDGDTGTKDALAILQYVAHIPPPAASACPRVGSALSVD